MKRFLFFSLLPITLVLNVACPQNSGVVKVNEEQWEKAINALVDRNVDDLVAKSEPSAKDDTENSKLPLTGRTSGYTIKNSIQEGEDVININHYIAKTWLVEECECTIAGFVPEIVAMYSMEDNSIVSALKEEGNWSVTKYNNAESFADFNNIFNDFNKFIELLSVIKDKYNDAELTSKGYKITGFTNENIDDGIYETRKNIDSELSVTLYVKFNSKKQISNFSFNHTILSNNRNVSGNYAIGYSNDLKYDFKEIIPNFQ